MNILYRAKHVTKKYPSGSGVIKALNDVSVEIAKGEIYVILGPSGSGKTTLLNMLSGLDYFDEGEIWFRNQALSNLNNKELINYRKENTGFIFQNYNLISTLTAYENIKLGEYLSCNPLDIEKIIDKVGLRAHINKYPHQLSGGQQQRVAIARVLVKNPKVIFCDEPTGALDEKSGREVLHLLQSLNHEYKTTLIMVTHNHNIAEMADKVIYFRNGKITEIKSNKQQKSAFTIDWS